MPLHRRRHVMLVTGASGFLGQHLVRGPAAADWEMIAPSSRTMDIRRRDSTIETIRDWKPNVVVHLAYRKGDRRTIVDGTRNVADGAAAAGARLVHLSTDIVFPGRLAPYTEADEPAPIIDYGRDKLAAERAVADVHPGAVIVRTSLLYGTDRPSPAQIDLTARLRRQPEAPGGMTFFTDEVRCPTHADDVARAIVALADRRDIAGPLHVAGPEAVSRAELAARMARFEGLDPSALATSTIADAGQVRPANVVLDARRAATFGIGCRPVSAVLTTPTS